MIIRTVAIILILQVLYIRGSAQNFIERVYLKDSSYHEGYVIEQAPAQYVKVYRLKEKDTLTVPMTQIWKLTKSFIIDTTSSVKNPIAKVKEKYSKAVFLELFGNGGIYSINYDMRTARNKRNGWGFRVGLEYFRITAKSSPGTSAVNPQPAAVVPDETFQIAAVPFAINYLVGNRKDFLELGVGATYAFIRDDAGTVRNAEDYSVNIFDNKFSSMFGTFNIGYRHIPLKNGVTYGASFTPIFISGTFIPYFGLNIGYHFK